MVQMKKQKGFTLIELIIVIIILGILAVTAAPKFLDIQDDAKQSAMEGIAGAVRSASQIAHSGNLITSGATVTLEGVAYTTNSTYLVADEICRVVGLTDLQVAAAAVANVSAASPVTTNDGGYVCTFTAATATEGATISISPTGVASAATCFVSYQDLAATGTAAAVVPPISSNTTNCS